MKQVFKFKYPGDSDEEEALRFEMIDDRGDKAQYREISQFVKWSIEPVFVYLKSEMVEA